MQRVAVRDVSSPQVYSQLKAADYVVELLANNNIDTFFGIPGGAIGPLFEAIVRYNRNHSLGPGRSAINLVPARHETGAAFMADGYARETGSLGVCCAASGPGSTNLITGVASAYQDKTPMLVLTPQSVTAAFDSGTFAFKRGGIEDRISVASMFSSCTKYSTTVSHTEQLPFKLMKAIRTALTYPRGPVHLNILSNIWNSPVDAVHLTELTDLRSHSETGYDRERFSALCRLVSKSHRLLFLLGDGALPWARTIVECAELLDAEIVTTSSAKGCLRASHPLNRGVVGFAGHQTAKKCLNDERVTYILAIGANLAGLESVRLSEERRLIEKTIYIDSEVCDGPITQFAPLSILGDMQKIFVDLKRELIRRMAPPESQVLGDDHLISKMHKRLVAAGEYREECIVAAERIRCDGPVKPQYMMSLLPGKLPVKSRFHIDAGNAWAWAARYLRLDSERNYRVGMRYGSMGWAIGAVIGAAIAAPDAPVVCITGDGSYLMSGQELSVAVQLRLPVVFIVLNDSAFGMVKHGQRLGGAEQIGYELPQVNFAMMAEAIGAKGITVATNAQFEALDLYSLSTTAEGPLLLDVIIDGEELPPIAERVKELAQD